MTLNLLQVFFIISGVIILFLAIDIARKQKFNALHFFVFIFVGVGLLTFTFFPSALNGVGRIFGLQRGADLLVYTSIIFLVYFVLLLLRKVEENREDLTNLIREIAINNSSQSIIKGKEVFIIPSYNEESVIISTIDEIFNAGYKNVIVVNDGSRDNTINKLSENFGDKIILLNHYKNRGQGAALETGFEYVRRYGKIDYVITFDADGQHDISDLKTFEKYLNKHSDVEILLGSRFLGKKQDGIPFFRKIIIKLGIVFTFFVSNINLSDTHNGFRIIKRGVLDKIKITIDGMGHASEILDIIADKKIIYEEVPVNIKYTDYSLQKGQKSSNAFKIALKMIWNKFFK